MKIIRGPRPSFRGSGPYISCRAPRNFRGQNIEIEKIFDISTPGPVESDEGPKYLRLAARLAPTKRNLIFTPVLDLSLTPFFKEKALNELINH